MIRPYRESDAEAVALLFTDSVHHLASSDYDADQRAAWAPLPPDLNFWTERLGRLQTLVAEVDGQLTGFISYELNGHVDLLYTSPARSRRGIASALYRAAESDLARHGISEIFTEASIVARPFFERAGFHVVEDQCVQRSGVTFRRYAMRKSLMVAEAHSIRAARAGEARLLSELALRSKAHWGYSPEFIEACRAELSYREEQLRSRRMRFAVLESAGAIIGFYALAQQNAEVVELDALFVEPRFIGRGFGRLLIEDAKSVAAALGAKLLVIQGDPNAESFYLAAGGVMTGTRESASIPGRYLPLFEVSLTADRSE